MEEVKVEYLQNKGVKKMNRKQKALKKLVADKKEELVQRLIRTDKRLFFELPRDAKGNVLPLAPAKQAIVDDLEEKISMLNSADSLTPAMESW